MVRRHGPRRRWACEVVRDAYVMLRQAACMRGLRVPTLLHAWRRHSGRVRRAHCARAHVTLCDMQSRSPPPPRAVRKRSITGVWLGVFGELV